MVREDLEELRETNKHHLDKIDLLQEVIDATRKRTIELQREWSELNWKYEQLVTTMGELSILGFELDHDSIAS